MHLKGKIAAAAFAGVVDVFCALVVLFGLPEFGIAGIFFLAFFAMTLFLVYDYIQMVKRQIKLDEELRIDERVASRLKEKEEAQIPTVPKPQANPLDEYEDIADLLTRKSDSNQQMHG